MAKGLSTAEAKAALQSHGFNELLTARPKNVLKIALEVVREPMFLLLISCGLLYMILGDYREGIIMLTTIFLIIFITFYQYRKTEKALDALRNLSSPRALVIRDGKELRISGREVVPGDLLVLNEGDRIPADAFLLESLNLTIDESLLTGESAPVTKLTGAVPDEEKITVFSGTLVVQGNGLAEVTATGNRTAFGKIGVSLAAIQQEETQLQTEMKKLIRNLFLIGAVLSIAIVLLFYFTRGNFLQSLLNGLTAAMAILPEEFPVVLTVFLALGAWRLSRRNVLTRKSSAIETLGSATVLCSDKTGTITLNKMEVTVVYNGKDIYHSDVFSEHHALFYNLIKTASQASNEKPVDPMEIAIGELYDKLYDTGTSGAAFIREYPLSRELMAMTRVMQDPMGESSPYQVYAKGAPETILKMCKLEAATQIQHEKVLKQLAAEGYRVIAVASAEHAPSSLPDEQEQFTFTFIGFVGLTDPVRPEVPQAIKDCYTAGIRVIMITGDYPVTAASIARSIGLAPEGEIISGEELVKMSDEELKVRIGRVTVFARVVPDQKLRIVEALKANNEIVAMTGDGVNDAPALKAAHIGVAMGMKGTDVAREASSLVLLDDNFTSIVAAIRLGRRIFDNLQKAMSYILAIHIPIIGLTLLPSFVSTLPLLLMPLHIVFMELIIDPVCSVAFESEQEEKGIMNRPPRKRDDRFFGSRKILQSFFSGLLLLLMVLFVYFFSIHEGHTEGEVRAIAFSALITGNIILILTNLSKSRTALAVLAEKNTALLIILGSAFIMLQLILFIPGLRKIFSFDFPGMSHFIPSFIGASLVLLILETVKYFKYRRKSKLEKNREGLKVVSGNSV